MTTGTRRRGSVLEEAIFEAVFEQLSTVGFARLTMEGVAAAAQTGKAALYRRWASRDELVRDAFLHVLPRPEEVPRQDTVRADLLALLKCYQAVIEATRGTAFQAMKSDLEGGGRGLMSDTIHVRVIDPLRDLIHQALERGAERGEVRPGAVSEQVARVGPAMIIYQCISLRFEVTDEMIESIVDEVVMPILHP